MRTYSFTASGLALSAQHEEFITGKLLELVLGHSPHSTYVTGACDFGDTIVGRWLVHHAGLLSQHRVVVPASRRRVTVWWTAYPDVIRAGRLVIEEMPQGTSYRDRNIRLGVLGDEMIGFPMHPEKDSRSRRSGAWQTLRIARQMGSTVRWWTLDGSESGQEIRKR